MFFTINSSIKGFRTLGTQTGESTRTLTVSGYKTYLACNIYYADNNNPLNWGCTATSGTVSLVTSTNSNYCGYAVYYVNVGNTNPVTISMNGHNVNMMTIIGIDI